MNKSSPETVKSPAIVALPLESTLNLGLRTGHHWANKSNFQARINQGDPVGDEYEYESVYSAENDLLQYYVKPLDYVDKDVFDSRILYSEEKINGDVADSWRILSPAIEELPSVPSRDKNSVIPVLKESS